MGYNRNYIDELNEVLLLKRTPDDISFTLNIPEHKFKKAADKFNYALYTVYDRYKETEVKMFHIILALQEYFEVDFLVEEILDRKNKKIIKDEMAIDYNINSINTKKGKSKKNATKESN